jgi:hypothetical protein
LCQRFRIVVRSIQRDLDNTLDATVNRRQCSNRRAMSSLGK